MVQGPTSTLLEHPFVISERAALSDTKHHTFGCSRTSFESLIRPWHFSFSTSYSVKGLPGLLIFPDDRSLVSVVIPLVPVLEQN